MAKAVKSPTQRIVAGCADDYVIEKVDVHGLCRVAELAGDLEIGRAGGRIAGLEIRRKQVNMRCFFPEELLGLA